MGAYHRRSVSRKDSIEIFVTPPSKVVSVKMDVELLNKIDEVCRRRGFPSRSEFIRQAVIFYIEYLSRLEREELVSGTTETEPIEDTEIGEEDIEEIANELAALANS